MRTRKTALETAQAHSGRKEGDLVKAVLQYLAARRIPAWRVNAVAVGGEYKGKRRFVRSVAPGFADIIAIVPRHAFGGFCAIECKSPTGKLSEAQLRFLQTVKQAGGLAIVARSLDDVKAELG